MRGVRRRGVGDQCVDFDSDVSVLAVYFLGRFDFRTVGLLSLASSFPLFRAGPCCWLVPVCFGTRLCELETYLLVVKCSCSRLISRCHLFAATHDDTFTGRPFHRDTDVCSWESLRQHHRVDTQALQVTGAVLSSVSQQLDVLKAVEDFDNASSGDTLADLGFHHPSRPSGKSTSVVLGISPGRMDIRVR